MPVYHYKAVAAGGEITEGDIDAPSQQAAIDRLQSSGYLPLSADEITGKAVPSPPLSYFRSVFQRHRVRAQDVAVLTRELATLLQAGLPLDHALRTLEKLGSRMPVKRLVQNIQSCVQDGQTLSDALEAQGPVFNQLYLNTIRAGEASGSLDTVLLRLADYLDRSADLRTNVISALIYPAILLVVAVLSILVLLGFVVPQFVPLFEDAGQALPLLTQFVFGSAEFIRAYWWLLAGILALVAWSGYRLLQQPELRRRWDAWCLRAPLYGDLVAKLEVARFTRTLGTLLLNGVPLLRAMAIVREVLTNRVLAEVVGDAAQGLEGGGKLARPLLHSGHFPPLAVELIQVGEETGQIENMLIRIADIYDEEIRMAIKRLLTLIEPVLILGLGAVIALIIVSILMAMLGLNELVI